MKTVFVGLSGGVDSSVAALRLKNQGYNVVGVFIKVWHPEWLKCNWEEERLDAMRVAAKLDIPFLTCDAEQAYKDGVADYFISEYKDGRTPNPDVLCNREVKFGAFLDFARKRGADYIATGHYAQNVTSKGSGHSDFELHRGMDVGKDQTYFLWTLTQEQLKYVLFPVGDTPKEHIRSEAEGAGLVTSSKKDSQGICFLGHIDIKEFLGHYIDLTSGDVQDESGKIIGTHDGAVIYTTGQRHGFVVNNHNPESGAHYVVARDISRNTITVSAQPPIVDRTLELQLRSCNWITATPATGDRVEIQTRYRQTPVTATVTDISSEHASVQLPANAEPYATGQSCVCYIGSHCLGGGIIK